ncbi:MAG: molybdopterin dinucleotide binding domain-containing protein [Dehalococcoidia bacterium]
MANGDWVYIETPDGRIKHKAELTDRIHPKVVHIEHGWWFPERQGEEPHLFGLWESNAGVILPDHPEVCDYQGGPPMRAVQCRIAKSRLPGRAGLLPPIFQGCKILLPVLQELVPRLMRHHHERASESLEEAGKWHSKT